MLRASARDAVGMSTVLEAIAARWVGLEVCGVSLVTNAGAGYSGQPLSHEEVLEAGAAGGPAPRARAPPVRHGPAARLTPAGPETSAGQRALAAPAGRVLRGAIEQRTRAGTRPGTRR